MGQIVFQLSNDIKKMNLNINILIFLRDLNFNNRYNLLKCQEIKFASG